MGDKIFWSIVKYLKCAKRTYLSINSLFVPVLFNIYYFSTDRTHRRNWNNPYYEKMVSINFLYSSFIYMRDFCCNKFKIKCMTICDEWLFLYSLALSRRIDNTLCTRNTYCNLEHKCNKLFCNNYRITVDYNYKKLKFNIFKLLRPRNV